MAGSRGSRYVFLLVVAPLVLLGLWEAGHYTRFGDFFGYGYHVDLVLDRSDIGVPRQFSSYCLRVSNYSLSILKFEGIQLPGGITDNEVIYHDRIEKWDEQTHSWRTVTDSVEDAEASLRRPNTTKRVWPGESIRPTGCYEVATVEGIHRGDIVRLVAFTSYSTVEGSAGQLTFQSPGLTVQEEFPKKP